MKRGLGYVMKAHAVHAVSHITITFIHESAHSSLKEMQLKSVHFKFLVLLSGALIRCSLLEGSARGQLTQIQIEMALGF